MEDATRGERYIVDVNEYKIVFGKEPIRLRGGAPSATPDAPDESADVDQPRSAMNGQAPLDAAGEEVGGTAENSSSSAQPAEHTHSAAPTPPLIPFRTDALRQPANSESTQAPPLDASRVASQTLIGAGQRDQSLLPSRAPLTAADGPRLKVISQIDASDELLTLQANEAVALGLARCVIANETELQNFFGAKQIFTIAAPWSEQLARVLTSWWMRTLLVAILVICFFGEMSAPGLGMFGFTGVACVALLAGGSFLAGLSQWWPSIAILAGLLLVALEILFLQGTFISGALGVLAFTGGVIGLFVVADPTPESSAKQAFLGMASLVTAVGAAGIVAWLLGPRLQIMSPWQAAVLHATLGEMPSQSPATLTLAKVDALARAVTDLRPVGKIEIDGVRFDARSEGAWISSGADVRILRLEGNEIIVEHVT